MSAQPEILLFQSGKEVYIAGIFTCVAKCDNRARAKTFVESVNNHQKLLARIKALEMENAGLKGLLVNVIHEHRTDVGCLRCAGILEDCEAALKEQP